MDRGTFVIVEGPDCCGKSSFVKRLRELWGNQFLFTWEPGGVSYGRKIRQLLLYDEEAEESSNLAKFHLYWGSKAENFNKLILPSLNAGTTVISDRFDGSTYAYQVSVDPTLEDLFWQTRAFCLQDVVPVYLYFEASVETQIARMESRAKESGDTNYFDRRGVEFRRTVDASYRKFLNDERIQSYHIDASLPKEEMIASAHEIFLKVTGM